MIFIAPLIGAYVTMRISAQDASLKQAGTSPIPKEFAVENFGGVFNWVLSKGVKHDLQKNNWELPPCLPSMTPRGDKASLASACIRDIIISANRVRNIARPVQRISVQRLFKDTSCVSFVRHNLSQHAQILIFLN